NTRCASKPARSSRMATALSSQEDSRPRIRKDLPTDFAFYRGAQLECPPLLESAGRKFLSVQRVEVSMPSIRVRENEYFDAALRGFKRACENAGVRTELRWREFYEKPT